MRRTPVEVIGLRGIPGLMGGVEAHCEALLPRIAALAPQLDIEVVGRTPYLPPGESDYRSVRIRTLYAPRRQGLEAIVSTFLGVLRAKLRRARMVHIHGIGPALLAPLARVLGMRVVVTHHSANYEHQKWSRFAQMMLRLGEVAAMRWANRVVVVAPWLARRLATRFPNRASVVRMITNGAPDFGVSDGGAILTELGLEAGRYILAVGRLVPEKRFELLIEAVRRSGLDHRLVIVGDADHEGTFARRLLSEADHQIVFAGRRQRNALRTLLENAGLFVLPSSHEGMPLVALEAATFGCPMILSDIEPNRDLELPARHYFHSGDVADLVSRIQSDWKHLRPPGGWSEQFDWNQIARKTLDVYFEAMS